MTIEALAGDVVALLDHLGTAEADLFGFSLGGLVAFAVALSAPARVGKLIVASADAHRPPGRESAPLGDDRLPTPADFQAWRDAYDAVAPDPAHFDEFAARTSAMVHEFPGCAQRAAAATPPAIAAPPARAAAVPARAAALAVRGGGAGRRGGGSFGMAVVEAARRGKQLDEVHGFAAAAVEFVDLDAAAESAGEDHRARRGLPQPGQQGALGAGFAHLAVTDLEAEVAGEAAAAGLQVLGLGADRGQQPSRPRPSRARRAGGSAPG